ncbi:MAG TPA: DUF4097 family beta strand repeat-containing protein [Acidimicrobiales bacterium]|nr:DUF4097 family beta strand repeat-containing protein [Acidimicrobiales bacterium]
MTPRLLAVLVVVVGLAGVAVAGLATFAARKDRTVFTRPAPVRSVEVDVEAGRVEVVAGPANEARVDRTRQYIWGAPEIIETLNDGVLRLTARCRAFVALGCKVDYRVEVPGAVSVHVRTDRGNVEVEGMTGMVEVETEAGGVRLVGTRGPVRASTAAGDIDGADLVAGFVDATTGAGGIRLSLAEPSARVGLRTDAGNIELALPDAPGGYRVTTETGAGRVEVTVPQEALSSRAVTATTGAGNITIRTR